MNTIDKIEKLERIEKILERSLERCDMCARNCNVNRHVKTGVCGQKTEARMTNAVLHFGEEPPLVKTGGAGAVFFSGCGMKCVYCQNFGFSQLNVGNDLTSEELGKIFIRFQESGAETLDLVTPEPHLYQISRALRYAFERGFSLPVVFNTSSHTNPETLELFDGIIDVYLADIRYTDDAIGKRYSMIPDYWTAAKRALREMYRQVGPFREERMSGLIVRHLILPGGISGTEEALRFISEELSMSVPISLMSQYFPTHMAKEYPEIDRKPNDAEYSEAIEILERYGLRGWYQPLHEKMEGMYAKKIGGD